MAELLPFLRTGGGSTLGADLLLLLFAVLNISPRSHALALAVKRPFTQAYTV